MNNRLDQNMAFLKSFIKTIIPSKVKWVLSGSTSLALQGVDVEVNDIDIVSDEFGAKELDVLLEQYCVKKLEYSPTEKYKSFYGKYRIGDVEVDVMGNFQYRLKNGGWSVFPDLDKSKVYQYGELGILVFSLEHEIKEYEAMSKHDKVVAIKRVLSWKT